MIVPAQDIELSDRALKRIHVVGQNIARVKRSIREGAKREEPCYTVKHRGKTYWCSGFTLLSGRLRGRQDFEKRLASGAVVWLETTGRLALHPMP